MYIKQRCYIRMQDEKEQLILLLKKQIDGQLSAEEDRRLHDLLSRMSTEEQEDIFNNIWLETVEDEGLQHPFSEEEREAVLSRVLEGSTAGHIPRSRPRRFGIQASLSAAVVFVIISVTTIFFLRRETKVQPDLPSPGKIAQVADVDPGKERAVFATEDGKEVTLDREFVGTIDSGNNFRIVRLHTGEIKYQHIEGHPATRHTVRTPRGGQINFILPDGTKVWLNAASSLTFSSNLADDERLVDMTGEIYFEVARDRGRAFIVKGNFGEIDVLGTKFNVNTYDRRRSYAALVEGSIRLRTGAATVKMRPNQLTTIAGDGSLKTSVKTNLKDLIGWKDGLFFFEDADIQTVADQLSRWYNIDVEIIGNKRRNEINGTISRDVKLSKMIDMLAYLGLTCEFSNNKLIIKNGRKSL